MDTNKQIVIYLTSLSSNIKTKFIMNSKTKTAIIIKFYNKNKQIIEDCEKNNIAKYSQNNMCYTESTAENIIINHLHDYIVKKIVLCICRYSFQDKQIMINYMNESLCLPFLKCIEYILHKFNNNNFIFHNFTGDIRVSFISSMIQNISKIFHYEEPNHEEPNHEEPNHEEESNRDKDQKIMNSKIHFLQYDDNWNVEQKCNNIMMFDCSNKTTREVCNLSSKIDDCNVIISFGKKICVNGKWATTMITQYNITLFIHFNKNIL